LMATPDNSRRWAGPDSPPRRAVRLPTAIAQSAARRTPADRPTPRSGALRRPRRASPSLPLARRVRRLSAARSTYRMQRRRRRISGPRWPGPQPRPPGANRGSRAPRARNSESRAAGGRSASRGQ
jgi:hypothetical protein